MLAMGTGIFASNKTSNTLVGLDQKFNFSGNYPKSFSAGMSPEDAARYEQFWQEVEHGLDVDSRIKINNWKYTPSAELYLKYKNVYDNPKYYDQITGEINWPGQHGDKNVDGFLNGKFDEVTLNPGERFDRYGSDYGSFASPEGTPYSQRALAPGTDLKPYSVFEVIKPIKVKFGEIAPWFDEIGGGIQYVLPDIIDELLNAEIIRRVK